MEFNSNLYQYLYQGLLYSAPTIKKPVVFIEKPIAENTPEYIMLQKIMNAIGYESGTYDILEKEKMSTDEIEVFSSSRRFVLCFHSLNKDVSANSKSKIIYSPSLNLLADNEGMKRKLWFILKNYKVN